MFFDQLLNLNATTTLNGAIGASDLTLTINSVGGSPSSPTFPIWIDEEILMVTNIAGSVYTVNRGASNTTAASHANGATIFYPTSLGTAVSLAIEIERISISGVPPHAVTHESGGSDQITVAGLTGLLGTAQIPILHATTHKSGGSDSIKLDEFAAPTDITTLNVTTSAHGLTPKLPNDATKYLDGTGAYSVPAGSTGWNPLNNTIYAPVPANYSWVNQGSATLNTTLGMCISAPAASGNNTRLQLKTAPNGGSGFTIIAMFAPGLLDSSGAGIAMQNSSSGIFIFYQVFNSSSGPRLRIYKMSSPTSLSSNPVDLALPGATQFCFMKLQDDSTNRIFSWSADGTNWAVVFTESRTTFVTANQAGIGVNSNSSTYAALITLLSWEETIP